MIARDTSLPQKQATNLKKVLFRKNILSLSKKSLNQFKMIQAITDLNADDLQGRAGDRDLIRPLSLP